MVTDPDDKKSGEHKSIYANIHLCYSGYSDNANKLA